MARPLQTIFKTECLVATKIGKTRGGSRGHLLLHPVTTPNSIAGVMRLYILCNRSRRPTKLSLGSVVWIFPLQAGQRNVFVLSRSCSEIHRSMQSSCASREHGHALTQAAFGVSEGVCRQMKQLRRLASVWVR